jgi:hypothetical protein
MDEHEAGVVTARRDVRAPADAVWTVLSDGWSYATWVVGASRVRDVDPHWPQEGALIHHSFGLWPGVVNDTTEVLRSEPLRRLAMRARGWPVGEAEVVVTIEPTGPEACTVSITEDAVTGPGKLIPRPVRQLLIGPRNVETLMRLALLAEGRFRELGRG